MSYSESLFLTHLYWFQISLKCNHKKLACDPHDACDRCVEAASYQHCDGAALVCTKCVHLSKADWNSIHKSRRRKLKRRKSADTLVRQDPCVINMADEGDQGQLFSQAQPPLSGVVANQPATPNASEDEDEPESQEAHTQGAGPSALRRLEKDLIDPDVDDFQGVPPTTKHGRRVSSEIYSNSSSESEEDNEEDNSKDAPPELSRHGSAQDSDQEEAKTQLPLIERARLVEFREVLQWIEANTEFTTGKPWSATPKEDAPRMACQDILTVKKKPEFVALSPSPFLAHLATQRSQEVQAAPKASEVASLASSGFSRKDMTSYVFTSGAIQTLPLQMPQKKKPRWLGDCTSRSKITLSDGQLQQLEQLARDSLAITSYTEAFLAAVLHALLNDSSEDKHFQLKASMLAGNGLAELAKRQIVSLQQIVTHRRDIALKHVDSSNGIPDDQFAALRHGPVLDTSELFDPALLDQVTEDIRTRRKETALDNLVMNPKATHSTSRTPSHQQAKKRPASATFTPTAAEAAKKRKGPKGQPQQQQSEPATPRQPATPKQQQFQQGR